MKKKIASRLLIFSLILALLGSMTCLAADQTFPDLKDHWSKDYVNQLATLGYIKGNPDGTIKPDDIMTREAFTSLLIRAMGITPADTTSLNFSDTSGSWAIASINEAVKLGILVPAEYPTGLVPKGAIKRSEACAMLVRALGKNPTSGMPPYKDTDKLQASQYLGYIKTASDLGLMSGYSNGNFEPFAEMTRAQAFTVIYKYLVQEGKAPVVPGSTTTTTPTGGSANVTKISIGTDLYTIGSVSLSFIVNYIDVPVKSINADSSKININGGSYTFGLNSSSNNPDICINNKRYSISQLSIKGDELVISPGYRKVHKFTVDDYTYTSDYVSLYIKSTDEGYYLSDMGIVDINKVNVAGRNFNLGTDKISIAVQSSDSTSKHDYYDIKKIDLSKADAVMNLEATDPVVLEQLGISDIVAILIDDNTSLDLNTIDDVDFLLGSKKYALSEVTIDASGNFKGDEKEVYSYSKITMVVDDMQYKIKSLQVNQAKLIFYCGEGSSQEWVIVDDEYKDADSVKIIKGASMYGMDQVIVVKRNVIRIGNKQYKLDSDITCQVDNKVYEINEIEYDSDEEATIIDTGDLTNTALSSQPEQVVFFEGDSIIRADKSEAGIYADSEWLTFSQIFISDPAHFNYNDTQYDMIGAKIRIDDVDYEITDTSWHGATQVLDIYVEEP